MQNLGFHTILTSLIWSGTIHPIMVVLLTDLVVWSTWKVVLSIEKVVWWTWKVVWSNEIVVWWIWKEVPVTCCFFRWKILLLRNPFSLFNVTHFLCFAYLLLCSPDRSAISSSFQTVESKFIIKSIKNRVQNFAYHQKSINSWSISGAAGNKSPKSGRSRSVREISTLPPKPRVEGSSRSVPAIGKKSVDALQQGVYRLFPCQNRPNGHAL